MVETIYDAPRTRLIRHSNAEKKTKNKNKIEATAEMGWKLMEIGMGMLSFSMSPTQTSHTHILVYNASCVLSMALRFHMVEGVLGLVKFPPRFWGTLPAPPPPRVVSTSTCRLYHLIFNILS